MGVKRQWKVMKLRQLTLSEEVRTQLIKDIIARKRPSVRLFAWKVSREGTKMIAEQAFFSQRDALKDWYISKKVWEDQSPPAGIVVYSWKTDVNNIIRHAHDADVRKIEVPRQREMDVAILPSSIQEDIQRTLKNQG